MKALIMVLSHYENHEPVYNGIVVDDKFNVISTPIEWNEKININSHASYDKSVDMADLRLDTKCLEYNLRYLRHLELPDGFFKLYEELIELNKIDDDVYRKDGIPFTFDQPASVNRARKMLFAKERELINTYFKNDEYKGKFTYTQHVIGRSEFCKRFGIERVVRNKE